MTPDTSLELHERASGHGATSREAGTVRHWQQESITTMGARRVIFVSQEQAVRMRPPRSAVLVSITDPGIPLPSFSADWKSILRLQFHDVDDLTFPGTNPTLTGMNELQAGELALFLKNECPHARRLVVHCKSGISRSAGVAKAAADWLGAPFPATYREYNRQVHALVRASLAKQGRAA